jgi:hypothetical protein
MCCKMKVWKEIEFLKNLLTRVKKNYYMKMAMFFQGSKNDHCFHDLMYVILKIIILELKLIDDIKRNWNLC